MTFKRVVMPMLGVVACLVSAAVSTADGQSIIPVESEQSAHPQSTKSPPIDRYRLTGRFHLQKDTRQGYLVLQCELPKGSYVYSLTQKGAVKPTTIKVSPSDAFTTSSKFVPDRDPIVVENDPVFRQRLEKHTCKVQFFIPIQIRENVDPATLQPEMIFSGQVCSSAGVCMPIRNKSIKAKFAGYFERTAEKNVSPENPQRQ